MKHNRYPTRKALEMGLERRVEQKKLLDYFLQANPDYQIQLNFSVPDKPGNVCIKLTGGFAQKLLPLALRLFEAQRQNIENKLIELDINQNVKQS